MEWARACGFDVPECRLHTADVLEGIPRRHAPEESPVLAVRRLDRDEQGARIHQEDFAQVMDETKPPRGNGRYNYDAKVETLAVLAKTIARARETFATAMAPHMPSKAQRRELVEHWKRVPLLREAGPLG